MTKRLIKIPDEIYLARIRYTWYGFPDRTSEFVYGPYFRKFAADRVVESWTGKNGNPSPTGKPWTSIVEILSCPGNAFMPKETVTESG